MKIRRYYYYLKPFLPRRLQIAVRSWVTARTRARSWHCWPVEPKAGAAPIGWRGWPEGKRFALILTHDVESQPGQEKCRQLLHLEETMGFRSSFNFVAAQYAVSLELHELIRGRGFELGVHGLVHDATLYASRPNFLKHARRINEFLRDWQAVGFRSPCMYHNLDWLQDLDIEYDASTFDTDPFEPQPEGVGTIFPFWVRGTGGRRGYVELPYTLPQDFTLFVLLRERGIEIWKRKLDWIAARGGMALLNLHPDYLCFGNRPGFQEYPCAHYERLLEYVESRYRGSYWNPLPREMARFWAGNYRN